MLLPFPFLAKLTGMHLGYEEEGFKTLQAIEYNEVAVKTFEHNNAGVPTYCGDIREFLKQMEEDPSFRASLGRIDAIHTSSPCQGFSKANRSGGQNDEANNELAYTFPDLLRLTGALVGSFENVEGMWSRKGMPYLRKVLIDCIELGYQVRVKILRCELLISLLSVDDSTHLILFLCLLAFCQPVTMGIPRSALALSLWLRKTLFQW